MSQKSVNEQKSPSQKWSWSIKSFFFHRNVSEFINFDDDICWSVLNPNIEPPQKSSFMF